LSHGETLVASGKVRNPRLAFDFADCREMRGKGPSEPDLAVPYRTSSDT